MTAQCAALEAELSVARSLQPREVEKEVARRMKPLLDQTAALATEVEGMAEQRAAMERAHHAQVRAYSLESTLRRAGSSRLNAAAASRVFEM